MSRFDVVFQAVKRTIQGIACGLYGDGGEVFCFFCGGRRLALHVWARWFQKCSPGLADLDPGNCLTPDPLIDLGDNFLLTILNRHGAGPVWGGKDQCLCLAMGFQAHWPTGAGELCADNIFPLLNKARIYGPRFCGQLPEQLHHWSGQARRGAANGSGFKAGLAFQWFCASLIYGLERVTAHCGPGN